MDFFSGIPWPCPNPYPVQGVWQLSQSIQSPAMWNFRQASFLLSMNRGRGWRWRVRACLELLSSGLDLGRPARFFQVLKFWSFFSSDFEGVWRHTCLSVDFSMGKLLLVENGLLLKETVSEELAQVFKVDTFFTSKQRKINSETLFHDDNPHWNICRHLMGQWTV